MKKLLYCTGLAAIVAGVFFLKFPANKITVSAPSASTSKLNSVVLPIYFEINRGQSDTKV